MVGSLDEVKVEVDVNFSHVFLITTLALLACCLGVLFFEIVSDGLLLKSLGELFINAMYTVLALAFACIILAVISAGQKVQRKLKTYEQASIFLDEKYRLMELLTRLHELASQEDDSPRDRVFFMKMHDDIQQLFGRRARMLELYRNSSYQDEQVDNYRVSALFFDMLGVYVVSIAQYIVWYEKQREVDEPNYDSFRKFAYEIRYHYEPVKPLEELSEGRLADDLKGTFETLISVMMVFAELNPSSVQRSIREVEKLEIIPHIYGQVQMTLIEVKEQYLH